MCKSNLPVSKIRPRTGCHDKIIEVRVPVRFYWMDGRLGDIEVGPLGDNLTPYCCRLLREVFAEITAALGGVVCGTDVSITKQPIAPMPEASAKAHKA